MIRRLDVGFIVVMTCSVVSIGFATAKSYQFGAADKAANVGRAVKEYCNQVDPMLRAKYRKLANANAHPHNVEIHCIGDEDY